MSARIGALGGFKKGHSEERFQKDAVLVQADTLVLYGRKPDLHKNTSTPKNLGQKYFGQFIFGHMFVNFGQRFRILFAEK